MCDTEAAKAFAVGGQIGLSGYSSYAAAKAEQQQARYEAQIGENNAALADAAAADAISRGGMEANRVRIQGRATVGKQRAAAAAAGIDVNTGVAKQLQQETEYLTEQDVATIRTNAARAAWGSRVEALNYRTGSRMARSRANAINPGLNAATTMLSQATQYAVALA